LQKIKNTCEAQNQFVVQACNQGRVQGGEISLENFLPLLEKWLDIVQRSCVAFHMHPRFSVAEASVKNIKTDTIWQSTLQRQGVTMYGG